MKITTVLLIGFGGYIGTMLRYLTSFFLTKQFPSSSIPHGTLVVNILGCLVIGLVYGLSDKYQFFTPQWRLFLVTGICGGYTTFSAFAYENISLLQQSNYTGFAVYSISSFILSLLAAFAGLILIKII